MLRYVSYLMLRYVSYVMLFMLCYLFKVFIPVWNTKILFRFAATVMNCETGLIGNCSAS